MPGLDGKWTTQETNDIATWFANYIHSGGYETIRCEMCGNYQFTLHEWPTGMAGNGTVLGIAAQPESAVCVQFDCGHCGATKCMDARVMGII